MKLRDKILFMSFGAGNLTLIYGFLAVTACFCILSLSCEKNKPKTQKGIINEASLAKTKIGADLTMTSVQSERLPLPHTKGTKPAPSALKVSVYLMQVKKKL